MQIDRNLCFTGHQPDRLGGRDESPPRIVAIKSELARVIRSCYVEGFRRFISGMAEGVDTWAAESVIALREEVPDVRLIAAVPFITQGERWQLLSRETWERVLRASDQVWTTGMDSGRRWQADELIEEARKRIRERDFSRNTNPLFRLRNEWMVDRAAVVVEVWDGSSSGTENCVRYAEKMGRKVVRIVPPRKSTMGLSSRQWISDA